MVSLQWLGAPPPAHPLLLACCRAAAENAAYHELVLRWMASRYTLRYSGAMVPDVHHMLAKVGTEGRRRRASADVCSVFGPG